jgi:hypothetical protein
MTPKPVIAVIGATGAQGGGLARAILADPARQFALRAITRKPDAPAARGAGRRPAPRSWPAISTIPPRWRALSQAPTACSA